MLWLEVILWATWAMMLAWWPCCCSVPEVYCANCSGTDPNAPQYLTVVIEGMVDGDCTACDDYNATWVMEEYQPCEYRGTTNLCGNYVDELRFWVWGDFGAGYRLSLQIFQMYTPGYWGCSYEVYAAYQVAKHDCMKWDGFLINNNRGSTGSCCDGSALIVYLYTGDVS